MMEEILLAYLPIGALVAKHFNLMLHLKNSVSHKKLVSFEPDDLIIFFVTSNAKW